MDVRKTITDYFSALEREWIYKADKAQYGQIDKWIAPVKGADGWYQGDCEDFCLVLLGRLRAVIPDKHLTLALCWAETGQYHAVALVYDEATPDTWVICNRKGIMTLGQSIALGYQFDKHCSLDAPWEWHKAGAETIPER